jgi:hypothetical protein
MILTCKVTQKAICDVSYVFAVIVTECVLLLYPICSAVRRPRSTLVNATTLPLFFSRENTLYTLLYMP